MPSCKKVKFRNKYLQNIFVQIFFLWSGSFSGEFRATFFRSSKARKKIKWKNLDFWPIRREPLLHLLLIFTVEYEAFIKIFELTYCFEKNVWWTQSSRSTRNRTDNLKIASRQYVTENCHTPGCEQIFKFTRGLKHRFPCQKQQTLQQTCINTFIELPGL